MKALLILVSVLTLSSTSARAQTSDVTAVVAAVKHLHEQLDLKGRVIIDARQTGAPGKVSTQGENDVAVVDAAARAIGAQVGSLRTVLPCTHGCTFDADAVLAFRTISSSTDSVVLSVTVWLPTIQPNRMPVYWMEYEVLVRESGGSWSASSKVVRRS
jgi:hypothetical protein